MAGKWWLPSWWLYRPIMRLAHRFNWHWMPPVYPERDAMLWCQWCGARYVLPKQSNAVTGEARLCELHNLPASKHGFCEECDRVTDPPKVRKISAFHCDFGCEVSAHKPGCPFYKGI